MTSAGNMKVNNTLDTFTPLVLLEASFDTDLRAILSFAGDFGISYLTNIRTPHGTIT